MTSDFLNCLTDVTRCAGDLALQHQRALWKLTIERKGKQDFVTQADREVERFIVSRIRAEFPNDGVLGEEGARQPSASGRLWIIDPIDGTHNFIRGMPHWGVSVGVLSHGRPLVAAIYLPAMGWMLSAASGLGAWFNGVALPKPATLEDVVAFTAAGPLLDTDSHRWLTTLVRDELQGSERRLGSATAALAAVALGHGDVYVALDDHIWDVCAASVIFEECGRTHSLNWDAGQSSERMVYVGGSAEVVDKVRSVMARRASHLGL